MVLITLAILILLLPSSALEIHVVDTSSTRLETEEEIPLSPRFPPGQERHRAILVIILLLVVVVAVEEIKATILYLPFRARHAGFPGP
jgi:hypothetical protein